MSTDPGIRTPKPHLSRGLKRWRYERFLEAHPNIPRAKGTNPRALGTNPRALGTNPKARAK